MDESLAQASARLGGWSRCWVLNERGILMGQLRERELAGDPNALASDVMLPGPSTFRPNVSVGELVHTLEGRDVRFIPVTTSEGRFLGVALREDVERAAREAAARNDE